MLLGLFFLERTMVYFQKLGYNSCKNSVSNYNWKYAPKKSLCYSAGSFWIQVDLKDLNPRILEFDMDQVKVIDSDH